MKIYEKTIIINDINDRYDDYIEKSTEFVEAASKFKSEVFIIKEDKLYNGKSIIGVMSIEASDGRELTLRAEGEDAFETVEYLSKIIQSK